MDGNQSPKHGRIHYKRKHKCGIVQGRKDGYKKKQLDILQKTRSIELDTKGKKSNVRRNLKPGWPDT